MVEDIDQYSCSIVLTAEENNCSNFELLVPILTQFSKLDLFGPL